MERRRSQMERGSNWSASGPKWEPNGAKWSGRQRSQMERRRIQMERSLGEPHGAPAEPGEAQARSHTECQHPRVRGQNDLASQNELQNIFFCGLYHQWSKWWGSQNQYESLLSLQGSQAGQNIILAAQACGLAGVLWLAGQNVMATSSFSHQNNLGPVHFSHSGQNHGASNFDYRNTSFWGHTRLVWATRGQIVVDFSHARFPGQVRHLF